MIKWNDSCNQTLYKKILCPFFSLLLLIYNDEYALVPCFQAQDFRTQGTKMRRKMWLQNMKVKLIVLGIVIALILIIVLSVCGGFKCNGWIGSSTHVWLYVLHPLVKNLCWVAMLKFHWCLCFYSLFFCSHGVRVYSNYRFSKISGLFNILRKKSLRLLLQCFILFIQWFAYCFTFV